MRRNIFVYSEFPAEAGVIRFTLAELFNQQSNPVQFIGLKQIMDKSFSGPDNILVLPGAPNGDGYRAQLGGQGFQNIREHVQKGGALLTICASTYLSCSTYSYEDDDGKLKKFSSDFNMLNAHAHGPLRELSDPAKRWGGKWARHDVAMLTFENESGKPDEAGVCYSKGPKLAISPTEKCDIMARFRDLAGQPPAIVGKQFGKGYAIFCSVSLDVCGRVMKELIRPIDDHFANAKIYAEDLAALEKSRDHLWDIVWRKLTDRPSGAAFPMHKPG